MRDGPGRLSPPVSRESGGPAHLQFSHLQPQLGGHVRPGANGGVFAGQAAPLHLPSVQGGGQPGTAGQEASPGEEAW